MLQGILLFLPIGRWGGGPAEGWWRGMGRDLRISPPPPPSAAVPLPMHAWGGIGRGRGNSVPRPLPVAIESSGPARAGKARCAERSEEHPSELQSLMRISYALLCLKKKQQGTKDNT